MIGGSAVREAALELRAKLGVVAGALLGAAPETLEHAEGWIGRGRRAGSARRLHRRRGRHLPPSLRSRGRGRGAGPGGHALLAHRQHLPPAREAGPLQHLPHLAERHGRLRRGGRSRDRPRAPAALAPRRGRRRHRQPPARGRQPPRRHRPGHRLGALRAHRLRRRGPAAHGHAHGLHDPHRGRGARPRDRPPATPSPFTPLGTKGVGESGISSALGAIAAAVEDAFPELDLRLERLPLTPERVWRALREARRRRAGAGSKR